MHWVLCRYPEPFSQAVQKGVRWLGTNLGARPPVLAGTPVNGALGCGGTKVGVEVGGEEEEEAEAGTDEDGRGTEGEEEEGEEEEAGTINLGNAREE